MKLLEDEQNHEHFLLIIQEISFKIQFLRLLQSFSDHHE